MNYELVKPEVLLEELYNFVSYCEGDLQRDYYNLPAEKQEKISFTQFCILMYSDSLEN